jgi:ParB family chromosome partitioning protein
LSFIERAAFALTLEEAGFQRSVIQSALSIDRAEVSKLIAVAKAVPADSAEGGRVARPRSAVLDGSPLADAVVRLKALTLRKEARKATQTDAFLVCPYK